MKKSHVISTLVLSLSMFCFSAYAEQTEKTKSEVPPPFATDGTTKSSTALLIYKQYIGGVQITSGDTAGVIYLLGGWTVYQPGSDCPTPTYAMIRTDKPGAKELLSVALTAKTLNKQVSLKGVCGYHPNYFEIDTIIF